MSIRKALASLAPVEVKSYDFPVGRPLLMPGVVPPDNVAPVIAADSSIYDYAASSYPGGGFPGFPYLSNLATRAEYRSIAAAISREVTREWIDICSKRSKDNDSANKISKLNDEFERLNVRGVVQKAAEHDALFGRGQIFLDIQGADRDTPLILHPKSVKQNSLSKLATVEPVWTTPSAYNASDPTAADFYKPTKWFVLGNQIHASRLLTITTRALPDILKPAFNFAGMSLSQLVEPYVDNWLRTRQSVADLINNFSTTALATSMDQVLTGDDDGNDLFRRADLFTATRSNKGFMLLDKDREELIQLNTPLSGLAELQWQALELLCAISGLPSIVWTGVSPGGLNASSDSELRVFYDRITAQQEAFYRETIGYIFKVAQLSLFGEIDPNLTFNFVPLYQMSEKEEEEIQASKVVRSTALIDRGVISAMEERSRLANDPKSGYQNLEVLDEAEDR